jgi:hypothetical protein
MVYPPLGIGFLYDLPNKPVTRRAIFKVLKTKEIVCKVLKKLELWFLWSLIHCLGRHKPGAGGFCLDLIELYAWVSRKAVDKWYETPLMTVGLSGMGHPHPARARSRFLRCAAE